MAFSSHLEDQRPDHMILLEYIKMYETIQDKESDLDYLNIQKAEEEAKLSRAQDLCQMDELAATIG